MIYIYGLVDPRNDEIRYIGASKNPRKRLIEHIRDTKRNYRVIWINKLKRENLLPGIIIIEECTEENWQERERYLISFYRNQNARLTNLTDGGDGVVNPVQWVRNKMSLSAKGNKNASGTVHSEESKINQRIFMLGKTSPAKGKHHSEESNRKSSESHKGQVAWNKGKKGVQVWTKESKEKSSKSHRGRKKSPETIVNMITAQKLRRQKEKQEADQMIGYSI